MLAFLIFLNGMALMVLEMAGARLLAPWLGTSTIVWTSIIGVILASLSLGNWIGGKIADKLLASSDIQNAKVEKETKKRLYSKPNVDNPVLLGKSLQARKVLSLLFLTASIAILFTALCQEPLIRWCTQYIENIYICALVVTVMLFSIPSVFCGIISPFIMRTVIFEAIEPEKSGSVIGRLGAIATLGSIIGTFLGGFVLIAWFGTIQIIICVAACMLVAAFISHFSLSKKKSVVLLLFITGAVYQFTVSQNQSIAPIETPYNSIRILEGFMHSRPARFMQTDPGSYQSGTYTDAPNELAFSYTHFYALGTASRPYAKRLLMLGGGGYSVPKWLLSGKSNLRQTEFSLDVVELDPGITQAAITYFNLPENDPRMRIFHEDARTFLNRNAETVSESDRYDLIFADIFNSAYSIPFHVGTQEAAKKIQTLLTFDGLFVMNIISALEGDNGRLAQALYHSFSTHFTTVELYLVQSPSSPEAIQNIMLVAGNMSPKEFHATINNQPELTSFAGHLWKHPIAEGTPALKDNFAPVDRYTMNFIQK